MVNPAYMTRMAHEIQNRTLGIKGHITSLKPIRPENVADSWETELSRNWRPTEGYPKCTPWTVVDPNRACS